MKSDKVSQANNVPTVHWEISTASSFDNIRPLAVTSVCWPILLLLHNPRLPIASVGFNNVSVITSVLLASANIPIQWSAEKKLGTSMHLHNSITSVCQQHSKLRYYRRKGCGEGTSLCQPVRSSSGSVRRGASWTVPGLMWRRKLFCPRPNPMLLRAGGQYMHTIQLEIHCTSCISKPDSLRS